MSENKRYYWLKLKKDFFEQKMIKILKTFENGNEMIMIFLKIELHSLENDGYIYYEGMLPTFEQELAIAVDEDVSLVREALATLIKFGAIEKKDEKTYYVTAIENCIGSETKDANRKRRSRAEDGHCPPENGHCPPKSGHFPPEIEKDIEKEKELYLEKKRNASSFSDEKKGGGYKKSAYKNYSKPRKPSSYDLEEFQKFIDNQVLVYEPNKKENKPT